MDTLACAGLDLRTECALTCCWVIHVFLNLLLLTLLLVLSSTVDQVILVRHATLLDFLLRYHWFINFLRICVHLGFGHLGTVVTSVGEPLLLPLRSLQENMVRPVETQLLEPLVHLLHFRAAQHVVAGLFIDGSDQSRIWVACAGLTTNTEAEDSRQKDSQVSHNDSFSIVCLWLIISHFLHSFWRCTYNWL